MNVDFDTDEFSDKISELMAIEKKLARHQFIEVIAKDGATSAIPALQSAVLFHPLGALSMAIDPEILLND